MNIDFTRSAVKDLHSRVLVSVQKIDFISKKIEDSLVGWPVSLHRSRSIYVKICFLCAF